MMATSTAESAQYTRLHITPFDQSLLGVVIPSSVLPQARNISYHTIETFPENRYGFVDLPTADADKLKRKLNGAVLKGTKMRVERARPEAIPEPTGEADPAGKETKKEKKSKDKSKKRKREVDVIPGVELEDRKVKRGWTTSEQEMIKEKRDKSKKDKKDKKSKDDKKDKKDKKKQKKRESKSKYTDGPECLFKTKLPETAAPPAKDSDDTSGHKKKKRKADREVVVHEFEKTIKHPSFLKATAQKSSSEALTFADGVGWVDSSGTVVEPVSSKRPPQAVKSKAMGAKPPKPKVDDDDETSSSGTSSDEESDASSPKTSSSEEEAEEGTPVKQLKVDTQILTSPVSTLKSESARPRSSGSLTIKIPPATPAKIHPLEALYKRVPKSDTAANNEASEENEPFSFFNNNDIEEGDSMAPPSQPPMTPFSEQDFEYRNVRSAAPTPDTAHPSRSFNLWNRQETLDEEPEGEDEQEEEEQRDEDTAMADFTELNATTAADGEGQSPISDFQKQFWESRGDLNRKWRKRRKTAAKEKRYRENRARAERAI